MGSLDGRRAVVTGVSRRAGIGYAIAKRLADAGAALVVQSWTAHDEAQPWGADPLGGPGVAESLRSELGAGAGPVSFVELDLADPAAPEALVAHARDRIGGPVDIVVANHARSSDGSLADSDPAELDRCWAVNARATVLLAKSLVGQPDLPADARMVAFSSGQHSSPMPTELPYALSKAALAGSVTTVAAALAAYGATYNCIDPGPTDTGWPDDETRAAVEDRMPLRRWGTPADAANLVAWLVGPEGGWVTGQLLVSDGGWMVRP